MSVSVVASIRHRALATVFVRVVRPSDGYFYDFSVLQFVPTETVGVKIPLTEQSDPEVDSRYSATITLPEFGYDVVLEYVDAILNVVLGEDTHYSQGSSLLPPPPPTDTPASAGGNYEFSKAPEAAMYPLGAVRDAWGKLAPLINPAQLKSRHLFGIPLVSYQKDPITGQRQVMTDPILRDLIDRAVSIAEAETHLEIMPRQHKEKTPFDRQQYASLGYMMLPTHPVKSLESLAVVASDKTTLYRVPAQWVEVAYIHTGQINIVPMTVAFQYGGFFVPSNSPNGGSAFLAILGQNPWIPAYWQVEYTTGFSDGKLPPIVNELIGVIAAIEALALLATTNARNSSHSVGMDGISQSISTPGPQIYDARITLLKEQKETLVNKIRSMYGTKLFTGVI